MKKVSLILAILITTLTCFSQDYNRVVRASKLEWKNDDWVTVVTEYPKDCFVIVKDWDVTLCTYKFRTYDEAEKSMYDDHVTYTWKCVNANGDKCFFMAKYFKKEVSTHSLYSILYTQTGVMYEYETE